MKTKCNFMKKLMLFAAAFAFCAVLTAKPVDANAATAPANFRQLEADNDSVKLGWDYVTGAYGYGVQISDDGVNWTAEETTTSNYDYYYSLNAGRTYYARIRTYNTWDDYYDQVSGSAWSTIQFNTSPANLSKVTQTGATANSITVSWAASPGATGYEVYYGISYGISNAALYTTTTATAITLGNLPSNSTYYVYVVPFRTSAKSAVRSYATSTYYYESVTVPTAPNTLSASRYSKTATQFLWVPTSTSDNTDGYDVEIYKINKKGKAKKAKTLTVADSYVSTYEYTNWTSNVPFNNVFKFRVRAYVNVNGQKIAGNWSSFKQYIPGAYVKSITRKRYNATSGTLKWRKVTGAQSYTVYWSTSDNGKWKVQKKNVKGTSCTVRYSSSALYNYYYVRVNKVKIDKKRKTGPKPASSNTIDIWRFL